MDFSQGLKDSLSLKPLPMWPNFGFDQQVQHVWGDRWHKCFLRKRGWTVSSWLLLRNKPWNRRKSSSCKWLHIFRETPESSPWLSHGTIQRCYKTSILLIVSCMHCSCRAWWDCTVWGMWSSWQLLNFKMAVHQYLLDFHLFAACTTSSIYSSVTPQYDKWPKM